MDLLFRQSPRSPPRSPRFHYPTPISDDAEEKKEYTEAEKEDRQHASPPVEEKTEENTLIPSGKMAAPSVPGNPREPEKESNESSESSIPPARWLRTG